MIVWVASILINLERKFDFEGSKPHCAILEQDQSQK
jgi:hypothetical protein